MDVRFLILIVTSSTSRLGTPIRPNRPWYGPQRAIMALLVLNRTYLDF